MRIRGVKRLLSAALLVLWPAAGHAATGSELERELYRELHRHWPALLEPSAAALACYERLRPIARFTPVAPRAEPAACASADLVRLERITMPDKSEVAVTPAATLLCGMAEAVVEWMRSDVGTLAKELGSPLASISGLDSYECRSRNHIPGAKLSEHGKGNALDIGALKLKNGKSFALTDTHVARGFREQMRSSACSRFTTVLGPGSDGYHNEHIHVDLAQRSRGYRLCQWDVNDPAVASKDVPKDAPKDAPKGVAKNVPLPPAKPAGLVAEQARQKDAKNSRPKWTSGRDESRRR